MIKFLINCFLVGLLIVLPSCFSVKYSTSGASIPPELKTFSVQYFNNRAPIVNPTLGQKITEDLRDKCKSQTSLKMVNDMGDANFEGDIIAYDTRPSAIQGNDVASKNRLTIRIKVKYSNISNSKFNFDTTFERYIDYPSDKTIDEIENDGNTIKQLIDLLTEDVFNKAFVNW